MSKTMHKRISPLTPKPVTDPGIGEETPAISPQGLCQCCTLAEGCTFPRDTAKSVTSCDEFVGIAPRKAKRPLPRHRQTKQPTTPYAGLCRYCSCLADCTFPKSASGVWHCDEYA